MDYQINVTDNDYDVDSSSFVISQINAPAHGSVTNLGGGNLLYTPNINYYGDDSFTYVIKDNGGAVDEATVYITVEPLNTAPTAADATITVLEHQTSEELKLNTLVTDVEVDAGLSGHYTFTIDDSNVPEGDSCSFDGSVLTYTASAQISVNKTIEIPYTVSDNDTTGVDSARTSSGTITINIIAVSDPPSGRRARACAAHIHKQACARGSERRL